MTPRRFLPVIVFGLALVAAPPALAVDQVPPGQAVPHRPPLDVDVWVNKDEGGVYRPGESMRIYFRTSADAYVLLYNIDTEGYIHLIYPYGPGDPPFVPGGRTLVVPSRSDPYELAADGPPGVEYVVALASPVPFRDLPWYLAESDRGAPPPETIDQGDDIDQGYVVGDPYVGMERLNRRIVPPGREGGVASSDTYFYIDRRVEYPRYVCADCHYHQPFFDPYGATCSVVDIRVDATWIHYSPVRWGIIRPRYYYLVRKTAPVRYRQSKGQWSSKDGSRLLRQRFIVSHELRGRTDVRTKDRVRARDYFDLRRVRQGRIWKGRDEVLRLRERRAELERQRQEARERVREDQLRRDRVQESRPGNDRSGEPRSNVRERRQPDRRETPSRQERTQQRRETPTGRDRAQERRNEQVKQRKEQQDRREEQKKEQRQDRSDQKDQRKDDQSKSRGRGR
jgi:hypothetical protein